MAVGVIGHGAIGAEVATALRSGRVSGHRLAAVLTAHAAPDVPQRVDALDQLLTRSDVVVEAAGQNAVREHVPGAIASGADVVLVSVGALVDERLRARLARGPGRVTVASGAVGGFDALRAAARTDGLATVTLTTTKPPAAVVQDWMAPAVRRQVLETATPRVIFDGSAALAVTRFPSSVNVAATLALATLGFERTRVRVVADPRSTMNVHVVEAEGQLGEYRFEFRNRPSRTNPRTSALTALSVLRSLADRRAPLVVGG